MLVDDITIRVNAGDGGKGAVAFNSNINTLGPTGTSGGRGGNVYATCVSDINALSQFRYKKEFSAENGMPGRSQFRDGHDGADITLKLPMGTVLHNLTTGEDMALEKIGETILIAKGGKGGKGNFHFRSSTNTTPKQSQPGLPGDHFTFRFELKLIADVGFVGLPNVGKSSLLNALTEAKSKVANYQFTTLEPNLGAYYEVILADIPGLIEGSSQGKGLGVKFLRHIERTRIFFHFISAESENPAHDYAVIRKELGAHNKALLEKPEILILSKIDMVTPDEVKKKLEILKKIDPHAIAISVYDDESLKQVKVILNRIKDEKFFHKEEAGI